ncbi:uncharacterized protein A4U43_C03F12690 [Asparagus officinalis]|uniref:Pectinesterase catalytic domain-containing protein n=1 Tax=Asparagus officinalis TaxID=4686 RepID=A0A5P1FDR9_ASPOF|nr:uncharacterized protein A4U43_C03F12690 [Asparagus officinalis]
MASTSFVGCSGQKFSPSVIDAKDGTGNFETLAEAVGAIPSTAKGRYTIYVKEGVYEENITIDRKRSLSYLDEFQDVGCLILNILLIAVVKADNFIGKCMAFENALGKDKGQPMALMSEGERSSFFLCELLLGYQDMLYVIDGRQFFRECDIYGTVGFIFGDAAMVSSKMQLLFL